MTTARKAFISYSHADDRALEKLKKHLAMLRRDGLLEEWSDHAIPAGGKLDQEVMTALDASDLFIALVSPDYLNSGYCYEKEFARAQALVSEGRLRIIPVIIEPCEWLQSPFKDLLAVPRNGKAVSTFTNENVAYLDVVTGIRRAVEADQAPRTVSGGQSHGRARQLKIKQDFDSVQKAEFADEAFRQIRTYFQNSCSELAAIDAVRAKFEEMGPSAFTATVVNRTRDRSREAYITVHHKKGRMHSSGDISWLNQPHGDPNSSNGSIRVSSDDYQMFLTMDSPYVSSGRDAQSLTAEQVAERLWTDFVKQAGLDYE